MKEGSRGLNNFEPDTGGFHSNHLPRKTNNYPDASSSPYQTSSSRNPSSSSSTSTTTTTSAASASGGASSSTHSTHNLIMEGGEAGLLSSSTSSSSSFRQDSPPSHLGRAAGGGGGAGVYVQPGGVNHTSSSTSYTSASDGVDMLLFGEDVPSSSSTNKGSSNGREIPRSTGRVKERGEDRYVMTHGEGEVSVDRDFSSSWRREFFVYSSSSYTKG